MIITMPVPPSANKLFANRKFGRGRGRIKTKTYKQWIKDAAWCMKGHDRIAGPVKLYIVAPHNGHHDLDNFSKATIDAISKGEGRIIDSDRCKCVRHISMDWAAKDSAQSRAKLLTVEVVSAA